MTKAGNKGLQVRKHQKKPDEQQDTALRDELHAEIENRTKACSNATYDCSLTRVDGSEFCMKHILQDPNSPYKQCAYTFSLNGKRCHQPAPKHDSVKDPAFTNYCFEHSRYVQLNNARLSVGKFKELQKIDTFMKNVSHYMHNENKPVQSKSTEDSETTPCLDPFIDVDGDHYNDAGRNILDYASDSSSDEEMVNVGNVLDGHDMDNSDNDSVDSQNDDILKHACIYTTEEATMVTKEKLIKLQALYIEQFQWLQHCLKQRRRKYLLKTKRERDTYCSIQNQMNDSQKDKETYRKLTALKQYHRRNGVEAVLHKKYLEKRSKGNEAFVQKSTLHNNKCTFSEGGVKCRERTLPTCKYCKRHILEDKKQVLYRACHVEKSGVVCQEAVPNTFEDATCFLHIEIPHQRVYVQKKYESETEDEDYQPKQEDYQLKEEVTSNCEENVPEINKEDEPIDYDTTIEEHIVITHDTAA